MKTLRLILLAAFLANSGILTAFAQNRTPADYDKMLEVLRRKLAEEKAKTTPAPVTPSAKPTAPETAVPKPQPSSEPAPTPTAPPQERAQSPVVEHTLQVLRTAVAKERGVDPSVLGVGVPSTESQASRRERLEKVLETRAKESPTPSAAPSQPTAAAPSAPAPAPLATVASSEPAPAAPAGPVTKQERLAALLLLYQGDKITPVEYHEQRAKILAEP